MEIKPVAYVKTESLLKADLPRQGTLGAGNLGEIRFLPGQGFEQALEDLEGMERIWVLFWMHLAKGWKAKVQPPREVCKKGVFATRSPNRPNPIGLSCVKLLAVKGLSVLIQDHDLVDGTPVLDIKPYLEYADSFPGSKTGWMEELGPISLNQISWKNRALLQSAYLPGLQDKVEKRLQTFQSPSSSNRVKKIRKGIYLQACQSWRILFEKEEESPFIVIWAIFSGYDKESLEEESSSEDLFLHREFLKKFDGFLWEKEKDRWERFLKEDL